MGIELERPHIMEFTSMACKHENTSASFHAKICRYPLRLTPRDVSFTRFYSFEHYLQVVFPHMCAIYFSPHAYMAVSFLRSDFVICGTS